MSETVNNTHDVTVKQPALIHPLTEVSQYGIHKAHKSVRHSFGLSIFAGVFIAIAFVFYITVTTGAQEGAWGLTRLAGGIAFSLGLILVVICGAELFTSTVLSSVAWAQKKLNTKELLSCWARVYVGNFVGAMLVLLLVVGGKMYLLDGGQWGLSVLHLAQHKLHHTWVEAFSLGVLCNLLVCLGIWMTFTSKDMLTKAILLILPVAMFVSSGFEHSIANLFMVPFGIVLQNTVSPEYLISLGYSPDAFADLTISHFIFHNLIPVTLGNIVGGGVMVGLGHWLTYPAESEAEQAAPVAHNNAAPVVQPTAVNEAVSTPLSLPSQGNATTKNSPLTQLTVAQLMDTQAVTLTAQQTATSALLALSSYKVRGAVVVDEDKKLIGFVSEQDLLRSWWAKDFELDSEMTVANVMQTEVLSVTPEQSIAELIEFMTVDKSVLYPVSDSGVMLSTQYLDYNQRLNKAAAKRPSIYPVIENGVVVATISRQHITDYLLEKFNPNNPELTQPNNTHQVA